MDFVVFLSSLFRTRASLLNIHFIQEYILSFFGVDFIYVDKFSHLNLVSFRSLCKCTCV